MHKALSLSPVEDTLTRIEGLLEGIYDQIQAIRDEHSQKEILAKKLQEEVRKAKLELKRGYFTDTKTEESLIAHFDGLAERANAHASHHKAI